MPKRAPSTKTGSLSRGEARKAVLRVMKARSGSAKKTSAVKKPSPWYYKRYLGHFGFGPHPAVIADT